MQITTIACFANIIIVSHYQQERLLSPCSVIDNYTQNLIWFMDFLENERRETCYDAEWNKKSKQYLPKWGYPHQGAGMDPAEEAQPQHRPFWGEPMWSLEQTQAQRQVHFIESLELSGLRIRRTVPFYANIHNKPGVTTTPALSTSSWRRGEAGEVWAGEPGPEAEEPNLPAVSHLRTLRPRHLHLGAAQDSQVLRKWWWEYITAF